MNIVVPELPDVVVPLRAKFRRKVPTLSGAVSEPFLETVDTVQTQPREKRTTDAAKNISFRWRLVWQPSLTSCSCRDEGTDDAKNNPWVEPVQAPIKNECFVKAEEGRECTETKVSRILVGQLAPIGVEVEFLMRKEQEQEREEVPMRILSYSVVAVGNDTNSPPTLAIRLAPRLEGSGISNSIDASSSFSPSFFPVEIEFSIALMQRVFDVDCKRVDTMRDSLAKANAKISPSPNRVNSCSVDIPVGAFRCPCNGCVCQDGRRGPLELFTPKRLKKDKTINKPLQTIELLDDCKKMRVHLQFNENSSHRKANPDSTRSFTFLGKFQGFFALRASIANSAQEQWTQPFITLEKFGEKYRSLLAPFNAEHLVGRRPRASQAPLSTRSSAAPTIAVGEEISRQRREKDFVRGETAQKLEKTFCVCNSETTLTDVLQTAGAVEAVCDAMEKTRADTAATTLAATAAATKAVATAAPETTTTILLPRKTKQAAKSVVNSAEPKKQQPLAKRPSEGTVFFETILLRCNADKDGEALVCRNDGWQPIDAAQEKQVSLFVGEKETMRPVLFAVDLHFGRRVRSQSTVPLFCNVEHLEPIALYDWTEQQQQQQHEKRQQQQQEEQQQKRRDVLMLQFSWKEKMTGKECFSALYELSLRARILFDDDKQPAGENSQPTSTLFGIEVDCANCCLANEGTLRLPLDLHELLRQTAPSSPLLTLKKPTIIVDVALRRCDASETVCKTIASRFSASAPLSLFRDLPLLLLPKQWNLVPTDGKQHSPASDKRLQQTQVEDNNEKEKEKTDVFNTSVLLPSSVLPPSSVKRLPKAVPLETSVKTTTTTTAISKSNNVGDEREEEDGGQRKSVKRKRADEEPVKTTCKKTKESPAAASETFDPEGEETIDHMLRCIETESRNTSNTTVCQQSFDALRAQRDLLINLTQRYRRKYLRLAGAPIK